MTPDMAAVARTGDRSVDFLFDHPGISTPPKDAPTRYQWQRPVEYSDFADRAAVARHFDPLFEKAAQTSEGPHPAAATRPTQATDNPPPPRTAPALQLVP